MSTLCAPLNASAPLRPCPDCEIVGVWLDALAGFRVLRFFQHGAGFAVWRDGASIAARACKALLSLL
jgi:hypothetical protein